MIRTASGAAAAQTAGHNDTIVMRENDRVVMTLDSDRARVLGIMSSPDEASIPLVHSNSSASLPYSSTSTSADGSVADLSAHVLVVSASVQNSDPPPPYTRS